MTAHISFYTINVREIREINMKITGIIAEYNPFHLGHEYQINESRRLSNCDAVVVVMSGNFVQRGEPAIIDKHSRARCAVQAGANLVIELPLPFACQNAELFALSAVSELKKLGVDSLSFGCETDDTNALIQVAEIMCCSDGYAAALKDGLNRGLSYPAAAAEAVRKIGGPQLGDVLSTPNNMLSVEYIKSSLSGNLNLSFYPVRRIGSLHSSTEVNGYYDSATAIRGALHRGADLNALSLTDSSRRAITDFTASYGKLNSLDSYLDNIIYRIVSLGPGSLNSIYDISEGLNNKIYMSAKGCTSTDELIMKIKSKRYTYARLRRILLNILLNITYDSVNHALDVASGYAKVLALDKIGATVLKQAATKYGTTVISNYSDYSKFGIDARCDQRFVITAKSTDIYYLHCNNAAAGAEYKQSPVYIEK